MWHLDVEFKVFIHGKDVIENVLGDARNDTHLVRVVQLALQQEIVHVITCETQSHSKF